MVTASPPPGALPPVCAKRTAASTSPASTVKRVDGAGGLGHSLCRTGDGNLIAAAVDAHAQQLLDTHEVAVVLPDQGLQQRVVVEGQAAHVVGARGGIVTHAATPSPVTTSPARLLA
jgi:hypothetical protein